MTYQRNETPEPMMASTPPKPLLEEVTHDRLYVLEANGERLSLEREFGKTPNGNDVNGRWVFRRNGEYVDMDTYRCDISERNNFILGEKDGD